MRRMFLVLVALLAVGGPAHAVGMLIPVEKKLPPLALLDHKVTVTIDEQVATTHVEQTFRNHTDRELEATYLFPVPKGASVTHFYMWVNGTRLKGELVKADEARKIYTEIVQRTKDPGLLEYMGSNLLKLRVFPVPAKGDQKIELEYKFVANRDGGAVEYLYPMKSEGKAATTLDKFSINVKLKSQYPITNVYSPTHAITTTRPSDKEAVIGFEKDQAVLDKDFQLFYTPADKDVGVTALQHRPSADQNGYFMLLMSPRAELSKSQQVPRDMVFVLDTSGSMRGKRMTQAQNALKYCLTNLTANDRFAILNFATDVTRYANELQNATPDNIAAAKKWVDGLEATGGTAIDAALKNALEMRPADKTRTFTVVFFTDGRPTIGETNAERILKNFNQRNTGNTRLFTFGVGDDVNAALLDALADNSRAVSTYVREAEDIEAKVSGLYGKISNPVLANLKLTISGDVTLSEVYPPQLPDLFHGSQLVVIGRFSGKGHAAITLTGNVGSEEKKFVHEVKFADKTGDERAFVEDLWARRKVGYLLDQIRLNGEQKELVEEVVTLAKRYGITTPYTSYLLVPDGPLPKLAARGPGQGELPVDPKAPPASVPVGGPVPVVPPALGGFGFAGGAGGGLTLPSGTALPAPKTVTQLTEQIAKDAGGAKGKVGDKGKKGDDKTPDVASLRNMFDTYQLKQPGQGLPGPYSGFLNKEEAEKANKQAKDTLDQKGSLDEARRLFALRQQEQVQNGKIGVDFSVQNNALRFQNRLTNTANRFVQSRNLLDVGGVWIDEHFDGNMKTVAVKAQSKAYFRILEKNPKMREVFALGNYIVWVAPNNTALIVDLNDGQAEMSDAAIDALFVPAPPAKMEKGGAKKK